MDLKPNEFWKLTPAEFTKYANGYRRREKNNLYGFALVASVIAEVNRDRKKRINPYTPNDFMPKENQKRKPVQTVDEQLAIVKILNQAFGGKELLH